MFRYCYSKMPEVWLVIIHSFLHTDYSIIQRVSIPQPLVNFDSCVRQISDYMCKNVPAENYTSWREVMWKGLFYLAEQARGREKKKRTSASDLIPKNARKVKKRVWGQFFAVLYFFANPVSHIKLLYCQGLRKHSRVDHVTYAQKVGEDGVMNMR